MRRKREKMGRKRGDISQGRAKCQGSHKKEREKMMMLRLILKALERSSKLLNQPERELEKARVNKEKDVKVKMMEMMKSE